MDDSDRQAARITGTRAAPPYGPAAGAAASGPAVTGPAAVTGPQSVGEAVDLVLAGLRWLACADLASVPVAVQADCLRALERAASVHTAARASVLSAFDAAAGYEDDAQRSPRTWLRWQTQVTGAAASASVAWMRRLRAHPAIAATLAGGRVSESWAREICDWTDQLPEDNRGHADQILLAAAAGGAELADLARLAQEMRRRLAEPDEDGDDGFEDRQIRLQTTLDCAGRLDGDLTPRCAEAIQAVLDALGKKAGPEDTRTQRQRHHDALEEACRRLIASGCLPDRAGQPTKIQLHLTLDELARLHQASGPGSGPASGDQPNPQTGHTRTQPTRRPQGAPAASDTTALADAAPFGPAASPGDACDATIIPIVTGRVDQDLLDQLAAKLTGTDRDDLDRETISNLILANAIALLSGPGQVASLLRTGHLAGPAATISLPLDLGTAADTIPPHLRRAVILRDRHCAAPGCHQPPAACHVHHTTPRSKGGRTKLTELILLCGFHHLIVVHTWGWTITLNPDGTTTMRSPDGKRVYHSHSPPTVAA
jgi:hypothetical protein